MKSSGIYIHENKLWQRRCEGRLCNFQLPTVTNINSRERPVPYVTSILSPFISKKFSQVIKLSNSLRWLVCRNGSYGCDDIQSFKHRSKDNVLIIKLGARPRSSGNQELNVPVLRIKLNFIIIIIFRERERNDAGSRMRELKCLSVHRLRVTRQIVRRPDLAFIRAALTAGEKVLAGKHLVNERVFVRR